MLVFFLIFFFSPNVFMYLFVYWPFDAAFGILAPSPWIEPMPPLQWKCGFLTTGPSGKSPHVLDVSKNIISSEMTFLTTLVRFSH